MASNHSTSLGFAISLIRRLCRISGDPELIDDLRTDLAAAGVIDAIRAHDDEVLFDWLANCISYQGVSDANAASYLEQHGNASARQIGRGLAKAQCLKLKSYWHYSDCRYRKLARTCSRPDLLARCPLPQHDLRNGNLNRAAYSLYLFMRDVAGGDFVSWLDRRLLSAGQEPSCSPDQLARAVIEPMTEIHGVSHKILSLCLSGLLLAGDVDRTRWQAAGGAMIVIDTLVHNWMHRSGVLRRLNADHGYGLRCYQPNGCAWIIGQAARRIDARVYNPAFPKVFPRFVQFAIWRFCSQSALNQCNGNRIDDRTACDLSDCPLFARCERLPLGNRANRSSFEASAAA